MYTYAYVSGGLLVEEAWHQIIIKLSYQSGRMVIKSVTASVAVSFGAEKEMLRSVTFY